MKKILVIAYALNPKWGSESGFASNWLDILSKYYRIEVFTDAQNGKNIGEKLYENTTFNFIKDNKLLHWTRIKMSEPYLHALAAQIFFKAVRRELESRGKINYSFIHCLTPAGIHSYNDLYKFGIPVIIGPLGGALRTPCGFEKAFTSPKQRMKEIWRDISIRLITRRTGWKNYMENATKIILGTGVSLKLLPYAAKEKCVRIPDTTVDTAYFIPQKKMDRNVVKVLFAGRLVYNKGPIILIEAARLCVERGLKNFAVELAGYGELENSIIKLINQYGLGNNVKLLGGLSKDALKSKYQECDIFCFPTLREPGGTVILEAMACGLPVITSNYGGPSHFINAECGIKIEMTTYDQYIADVANALNYLIVNEDIRNRMGSMARERVKNEFSIHALEIKMLDLYRSLS